MKWLRILSLITWFEKDKELFANALELKEQFPQIIFLYDKDNMFEGSNARIGDVKACPDTEAINTKATTQTAVFNPSSKDELANAIRECVLEEKDCESRVRKDWSDLGCDRRVGAL